MVMLCIVYRLALFRWSLFHLRRARWPALVACIAFSYLTGLGLESLGSLGIKGHTVLWRLSPSGPDPDAAGFDKEHYRYLLGYSPETLKGDVLASNVERRTVLMQTHGNGAMALFLCAFILVGGALWRVLPASLRGAPTRTGPLRGVVDLRDPQKQVLRLRIGTCPLAEIVIQRDPTGAISQMRILEEVQSQLKELHLVPVGRTQLSVVCAPDGTGYRDLLEVLALFPEGPRWLAQRECLTGVVMLLVGLIFLHEHRQLVWRRTHYLETAKELKEAAAAAAPCP